MTDAHAAVMDAHWGGGAQPFGASWQKTMMWIFIVTDGLLFSGLLCGYGFLRMASKTPWPSTPEAFSIPFIALMTFILITSSAFMASAVTADPMNMLDVIRMNVMSAMNAMLKTSVRTGHGATEALVVRRKP